MREVVPGVFTWSRLSAPHGYDFNGTFVPHPGGNLCVDPVEPEAPVLARLVREGVATVLLTNRNHLRRADLVRERTGARILIHPADAPHALAQGATIDGPLLPGARHGPFTVIAVAGKSPGEVALYWPQRRLLLVGDALVGNPPGEVALLRAAVLDDPARLRASVRALLDLDFDVLLVGDGVPILAGARDRVRTLVAGFDG